MALGIADQVQCCRPKKRDSPASSRLRIRATRGLPRKINMTTFKLFLSTIKTTLTSLPALAIYALIYALLLATFFKFIWTREATVWQVMVTYSFMVLIPAEFFIFQAAIIDRVR